MKKQFLNNLEYPTPDITIRDKYFKGSISLMESIGLNKQEMYSKNNFDQYSYLDSNRIVFLNQENYQIKITYDKEDNLLKYSFEIKIKSLIPYEDYYSLYLIIDATNNQFNVENDKEIRENYSRGKIEESEMNKAYNTLNKLIKEYVNTNKIEEYNPIIDKVVALTKRTFFKETPTIDRKEEIIKFLQNSKKNPLFKELLALSKEENIIFSKNNETCILMIRKEDNQITGISYLMKKEDKYSIAYSILDLIKNAGYLKILLYLSCQKAKELGIKELYIEEEKNNILTDNSIKLVGGKLEKETIKKRIYKINIENNTSNIQKNYIDYIAKV